MATNTEYVTTGKPKKGGAAFRAPLGALMPVSATEELDKAFAALGYISEDGVTNSNSPSSESLKAWGGDTVMNYRNGRPDTFKFTLIEALNVNVLKTVYGDENVTGDLETGIHVKANNDEQKEFVWVFDMVMKGGVAKRVVVPCASVTAVEDIVYKDNTAVSYGTTISATHDASGNTHHEYIIKTAAAEIAETKAEEGGTE